MNYETVIYEKRENYAIITLNRPEKLNAINSQLSIDMNDTLSDAEGDRSIIAVILTGAGRGFCAGADLGEVKLATEDPEIKRRREQAPDILEVLNVFPKPIVAAVNGIATAGGFEFILYSDIVIAAESARIGDAHANFVGIGPAAAAMAPYKMNRKKAAELLLTGDIWPAVELEKAGLVNHVVPDDKLMEKAEEIAAKIASHMPLAMTAAKTIMNRAGLTDPETLWGYVNEVIQRIARTDDFMEGMRAFAEKRKPVYRGE